MHFELGLKLCIFVVVMPFIGLDADFSSLAFLLLWFFLLWFRNATLTRSTLGEVWMVSTCASFDYFILFFSCLSLFPIISISLVAGIQIADREEANSVLLDLCSCQLLPLQPWLASR